MEHIELILELFPDADRDKVAQHLRGIGFDPLPMKAGILLSAEVEDLRRILPALSGNEIGELSVPDELSKAVRSIHIFKPRSPHST
jgi:hypothetical protein